MTDGSGKTRLHVGALIAVAVITWYGALVFGGRLSPFEATPREHLSGITTAISVAAFAALTFQRRLWRWKLLYPWFVDIPLLAGNWEGNAFRKFKEGKPNELQVPVRVKIEQPTISTVRYIQTMTDGSAEGHTESCQLFLDHDGKFYLEGIYQVTKFEGHPETAGRRKIYYGAMRLQLDDGLNPNELSGSYWSDEFTTGRVVLRRNPNKGKS
jgi:hypothetical protein